MANIFYQGEEKRVTIDVSDNNGEAIDLSILDNIIIYLFVNRRRVNQYALPSKTDYEDISLDNDVTGRLSFPLSRVLTKTFPAGSASYEMMLISSSGETSVVKGDLFEIKEALTRDEQ